jgi:hypothetical protein
MHGTGSFFFISFFKTGMCLFVLYVPSLINWFVGHDLGLAVFFFSMANSSYVTTLFVPTILLRNLCYFKS